MSLLSKSSCGITLADWAHSVRKHVATHGGFNPHTGHWAKDRSTNSTHEETEAWRNVRMSSDQAARTRGGWDLLGLSSLSRTLSVFSFPATSPGSPRLPQFQKPCPVVAINTLVLDSPGNPIFSSEKWLQSWLHAERCWPQSLGQCSVTTRVSGSKLSDTDVEEGQKRRQQHSRGHLLHGWPGPSVFSSQSLSKALLDEPGSHIQRRKMSPSSPHTSPFLPTSFISAMLSALVGFLDIGIMARLSLVVGAALCTVGGMSGSICDLCSWDPRSSLQPWLPQVLRT